MATASSATRTSAGSSSAGSGPVSDHDRRCGPSSWSSSLRSSEVAVDPFERAPAGRTRLRWPPLVADASVSLDGGTGDVAADDTGRVLGVHARRAGGSAIAVASPEMSEGSEITLLPSCLINLGLTMGALVSVLLPVFCVAKIEAGSNDGRDPVCRSTAEVRHVLGVAVARDVLTRGCDVLEDVSSVVG